VVPICPLGKNNPIDFFTSLLTNKAPSLCLVDHSRAGHQVFFGALPSIGFLSQL